MIPVVLYMDVGNRWRHACKFLKRPHFSVWANHTNWLTVCTSSRPMSVHSRCVIERFVGVYVLFCCFVWIVCWYRDFFHRTESVIVPFLFTKIDTPLLLNLPLCLGWLLVCCLYKDVYLQVFKCASFWLHGCCGEWENWARKPIKHTIWMAVVTPTGHPKSVRNRCVIELFCGVVCVFTLPFCHFCWCRGFCHRTESDLFLFLL